VYPGGRHAGIEEKGKKPDLLIDGFVKAGMAISTFFARSGWPIRRLPTTTGKNQLIEGSGMAE
jgi:hypothetical protein